MNLSKDEIHEELLKIVKYPRFYDFDHYTNVDEKGVYRTSDAGGVKNGNTETNIIHPLTGKPCVKPSGGWRYKDDEIKRMIAEGIFEFGKDENTIPVPKRYLKDFMYQVPKSVLYFDVQGTTKWLKNINIPFDFPKSVDLLKYLFSVFDNDSIILDFFSGSATAAHAVMQLNAEDNGNRKYILVQIPELCSESSEAFKKGYKNICDLGETRIKKSAELIKEETKAEIDYGFRVYKVDSSNMKDVYYKPGEMGQMNLMEYLSNIKEDRTPEDLLTQVGLKLDLKIEEQTILSNKVFYVENNSLVACFDEQVDINIIDEICKCNPMKVVFKDISFKTDKDKINLEERIKKLSPDTEISIL